MCGSPFLPPAHIHIVHFLGREGDRERVFDVVLSHGGDMDVLGVREVGLGGSVEVAHQLSDFTNSVGAVVEEEQSIAIWSNQSAAMQVLIRTCTYPGLFALFLQQRWA
jgi:hypothetical protein